MRKKTVALDAKLFIPRIGLCKLLSREDSDVVERRQRRSKSNNTDAKVLPTSSKATRVPAGVSVRAH